MIISFLIPTYNQINELNECVKRIIPYKGNDIEIVVNDNCSEEPIEDMLNGFGDSRIHFYKNSENLGHPRSVIHGFRRCKGKFVFLLRTIDYVIPETIPYIIDIINRNPDISYITGSCYDELGEPRIIYKKEERVPCGFEALKLHNSLYVHPSGSLYNKEYLDLDMIEDYQLNAETPWRISYSTHQQMRLMLSQRGDFYVIKQPIWIYTYTERIKKKSVQFKKIGEFFPDESYYVRMRYRDEMRWIRKVVGDEYLNYAYLRTFGRYLIYTTWQYWDNMKNTIWREHYQIGEEFSGVDVDNERRLYLKDVENIENEFGINDEVYFKEKERYIGLNEEYCKEHCKNEYNV